MWSPGGRRPVRKRAELVLFMSMPAFAIPLSADIACSESSPQRQKPGWGLLFILEPTVAESCSEL